MKLFSIYQNHNRGYDTCDSAVVAAEDDEQARRTHPSETTKYTVNENGDFINAWTYGDRSGISRDDSWVNIKHVKVDYIGEAADDVEKGVICASFNAG